MSYIKQFKAARLAGVPIIVIRTADYASVIQEVKTNYTGSPVPLLQWDIVRGVMGIGELGAQAARAINVNDNEMPPAAATGNPVDALQKIVNRDKMPEKSVIFMMNLQIVLESRETNRIAVIQGIWNCRDSFKSTQRTLVLLCPDLKVPPELVNDVIVLDVPLPTNSELAATVSKLCNSAGAKQPLDGVLSKAVDAISGLSGFSAEQVTAMSLSPDGLNIANMWDHKKSIIKQSGGLNVYDGPRVTFDDLGGLEQMKSYLRMVIKGKRPPNLVVLVDEIEKQMSGMGDSSGVNMDAFGQLLTGMQDNGWGGVLLPGFPGTGKTEVGKAMGAEAGGLFLTFDMGGMKSKFVGDSEKLVRNALKMLKAMGGSNVFWIGTCNSMAILKPELKRRFSYGTFFFDLPTATEREPIWDIYMEKFAIKKQKLPYCSGWTGAEIRICCERADEFNIPLLKAAKTVTSVAKSMGDEVSALRKSANQKYLSASKEGYYEMFDADIEGGREEIRRIGKSEEED